MTDFKGNISVSNLKQVYWGIEKGYERSIYSGIVNYLEPIDVSNGFNNDSNAEILFEDFYKIDDEEVEVRGLLHDLAVYLFDLNQDFRTMGIEPDFDRVLDILEGSVKGTRKSNSEIKNRINRLEKKFGIEPDEILNYSFDSDKVAGLTVSDLIEEIADYQMNVWMEETKRYNSIDSEVQEFVSNISGRMDLKNRMDERDEIREEKLSTEIRDQDIFQIAAYWFLNDDKDAEAVLEYPLINEKLSYSPKSDDNDFIPRKVPVIPVRDAAISMIEQGREKQQQHFENYNDREEATRKALIDVGVKSYERS